MRVGILEHLLLNDLQFSEAWVKKEMEDAEEYFKAQVLGQEVIRRTPSTDKGQDDE